MAQQAASIGIVVMVIYRALERRITMGAVIAAIILSGRALSVAMNTHLKLATEAQALFANPAPLIVSAINYVAIIWPLVRYTVTLECKYAIKKTH